jgi:creatinine amidohydrolase
MTKLTLSAALLLSAATPALGLPANWEDLTGPDFNKALVAAKGVCILPFGSIEKFGPAGPLGTNLYMARMVAAAAAKQEYAVIFPPYYAANTTDVSNHRGAIAYSPRLQRDLLEETVDEMGRNGCTKVLISNGHSTNMPLIQWFIQNSLAKPHSYTVYATYPAPPRMSPPTPETAKLPAAMQPSKLDADGHGGEERISLLMAERPDLVHPERARDEESVAEGSRHLPLPGGQGGVMVGVTRAVEAPTSYIGDASGATAERGRALLAYAAERLMAAIRAVKADTQSPQVQRAFEAQRAAPR